MAFDLIIFDCDGTLVDSEKLGGKSLIEMLAKYGVEFTLDDYMNFIGRPAKVNIGELQERYPGKLPEDFSELVAANDREIFAAELQPMPGTANMLQQLSIPKCVASSSSPQRLGETLRHCGLWDFFAPHVFSSAQVKRGKPAPDLFLFAAKEMGFEPSRCLVIEDSIPGVTAGKAAGMTVFGFCGGSLVKSNHDQAQRQAGAVATFTQMAELPALLKQYS